MEKKELGQLRKFQFIILNIFFLCALPLLFLYFHLQLPQRYFYLIVAFILILSVVIEMKLKYPLITSFSTKMKRLSQYEKDKMGNEWQIQMKFVNVTRVILVCIFLFLTWITPKSLIISFGLDWASVFILIFGILIFINLGLYLNNRKIDKKSTGELKGFSRNSMIISIIIGIFFAVITIISTVLAVMN
ncbi:hypothetical protein [Rossellomorea aquimaris]|uniref:hypothetical protein n=1 Tax=Rossellomorea aquimaris TaxID=189382 RepID=UPI0007D054B1|nr:hypothetical protein [Rossellomorea aquimaris]